MFYYLTAVVSFALGFMLCAILAMGKDADLRAEIMRLRDHLSPGGKTQW